jgi:hypothetical protein
VRVCEFMAGHDFPLWMGITDNDYGQSSRTPTLLGATNRNAFTVGKVLSLRDVIWQRLLGVRKVRGALEEMTLEPAGDGRET